MNNLADTPFIPETDYEKLSYGKVAYKRVQRLRRKGRRRGIEVPPLGFELTRPEKPRIVFWIAAIFTIVLFVGILVGTGFLAKFIIDVFSETFEDSGGFFQTLFDPAVFIASAGFSVLPALLIIMAYLMLVLIVLIPFMIAIYCYILARNTFYMARCSKEEFAKGELIQSHVTAFIWILVTATAILIAGLVLSEAQNIKTVLWLVYVGIVIIFGGMLTLIIIEKVKCNKWFESLDEFKKQNFLEHDRGLRQVKRRLHWERKLWNDFGRF